MGDSRSIMPEKLVMQRQAFLAHMTRRAYAMVERTLDGRDAIKHDHDDAHENACCENDIEGLPRKDRMAEDHLVHPAAPGTSG